MAVLLTVSACTPFPPRPPGPAPEPVRPAAERVLAGTLRGRTAGRLLVVNAASRVDVQLVELPGLLYRISTPADAGLAARVTGGRGLVRVGLRPTSGRGPDTVKILLNRSVRWDIRLPAGGGEQRLDLAAGRIDRVELGASGLVEMALPRPTGTVPVVLRGGAGAVVMTGPAGVPMRVMLSAGAGSVVTPWTANNGTAAGATLAAPGWTAARHRYAIHLREGVGTLTIR